MRENNNINNCKYCGHKIRKVNGVYPDAKYHRSCEAKVKDFIFDIGKEFSLWADNCKTINEPND